MRESAEKVDHAMTMLECGPEPRAARAIVRSFEPVSWAYMGLGQTGTGDRITRVRAILDLLERDSAPSAAMDVVRERLLQAPVSPTTAAVFVDADATVLHEQLVAGDQPLDRAGCTLPADVIAMLAADQQRPPFVCVVVDRAGADITYSTGADAPDRHAEVTGPDDDIRHNAPGGWAGLSQSRFERRATDSWLHNAHRVADRVAHYMAAVGAQVVIIAGEEHVAGIVRDRLPVEAGVVVEQVAGSRSADRARSVHAGRLRDALHRAAAVQTQNLLDVFAANVGADLAVQGVRDTLAALAAGRVSTLLVDPVVAESRTWFAAGATAVYASHDDALMSGRPVDSGPLARVAVRSALLSDARVRILPPDTASLPGIGALCRFRGAR